MSMIRKYVRAAFKQLPDDEVEVVISTAALARDGDILIPQGCRLENYIANPIVLWGHDTDCPIGTSEDIVISADQITARVRFAPPGISAKADEIRGLVKAGIIRTVSVGFDPIDGEPLDPKKPKGGQRITDWELLEWSFVSVPADPGAVVTARANGDATMPATTTQTTREAKPTTRATGQRTVAVIGQRGLYQVAQLCYLFQDIGYQLDMAKWEASVEGDASKVPGMLGALLHDAGDVLLAMAQEEIAEALAGVDVEPDAGDDADEDGEDAVLTIEERAHIRAATTRGARAFRRGLAHAKIRAGKTLSTDTVRCLREAQDMHEEAMDLHRSAIAKHKKALGTVSDLMDRAGAGATDEDSTEVQTSAGDGDSEGATNGRMDADYRQRQAQLLAFGAGA